MMTISETLELARKEFGDSNVITTYSDKGVELITIRFHGKVNRFVTAASVRRLLFSKQTSDV